MKLQIVITAGVLLLTLIISLVLYVGSDSWMLVRMLESLEADLADGDRYDEAALKELTRDDRQQAVTATATLRTRLAAGTLDPTTLAPLIDRLEHAYEDATLSLSELRGINQELASLTGR